MSRKAKIYLGLVIASGLACLTAGVLSWHSDDIVRFLAYAFAATLAGVFKVSLPGVTGTMSVNFLFVFIGIAELGLSETLIAGCAGAAIQCYWKAKRPPELVQVAFNVANMAVSITLAHLIYGRLSSEPLNRGLVVSMTFTAMSYFLTNTYPVAVAIAVTEGKAVGKVWKECYFWSFPHYLVGAAVAALFTAGMRSFGWEPALLMLPVVYLIYRSYRLYFERLEQQRNHATEMENQVSARTSDLTNANQELIVARDKAQEVARLKSEFLANMSHHYCPVKSRIESAGLGH